MVRNERGHTLIEVLIAGAVITILAGVAVTGGRQHFSTIGRAYDDLRLTEAASSRLAEMTADDFTLRPGEREFDGPAGVTGRERVREIEPGLFEITVRTDAEGALPVTLVTLAARGGDR